MQESKEKSRKEKAKRQKNRPFWTIFYDSKGCVCLYSNWRELNFHDQGVPFFFPWILLIADAVSVFAI